MKMKGASHQYTRAYIFALSLLALLTISTQVFIQFLLSNQKQDAHIINISGRQRMLCQKLTKEAFIVLNSQDSSSFQLSQESFKESLYLWNKYHKVLQNQEKISSIKYLILSKENQQLFDKINPYQQAILELGNTLLNATFDSPKSLKENIIQDILSNESTFLELMNQITFQFEKESAQKSQNLALIEQSLMIATLLILILEGWLIFRPITKKIHYSLQELEEANKVIENDRIQLEKNTTNLKVIQKVLLKRNSDIENQKSLLEISENVSRTASFDYDYSNNNITVSENAWKLFELSPSQELTLDVIINFLNPDSLVNFKKSLSETLTAKKKVLQGVYQVKSQQQYQWLHYRFFGKILYDSAQSPVRILGSVRDITEQIAKQKELESIYKQLEEQQYKLQNAYSLLEKSSQAACIGSWEIDLKSDKMNWSKVTQDIYGIDNGSISTKNVVSSTKKWLTFYHLKNEQEKIEKALQNCQITGVQFDIETKILTKKKEEKWIRVIGIPSYQKDEIVSLYGLVQDINERKQYEDTLERLAVIAQKTSDLIVVTDRKGRVEWVNDSFTRVTEYTFEEVKGKKPGKLLQGVDTNPEHVKKIAEGIAKQKPFSQEILNYTKSGKPYWNYINITPILDEEKNLTRFIGIQYNITKLKNAEQQILIKNQQLKMMLDTLEVQKNDIISSIEYAQRIQKAVLSDEEKGLQKFKNSFVFYQPRDIISGDFYWFSDLGEKQVVIMADCTGHGVPGAFMTMLGATALNEIINEGDVADPAEVLYLLDKKILQNLHSGKNTVEDGMDLGVLFFEKDQQRILYAGAKIPLYYKHPKSQMNIIKGSTFPVGSSQFQGKKKFENHQIDWQEDTWFYLASDGFQDQFGGENNKKFMIPNFRGLLSSMSHLGSEQQCSRLQEAFGNWKQDKDQTDDVLVVGVQI